MDNSSYPKLLVFLAATFFLCGCAADDVLGDGSGGVSGGDTGGVSYSNLVLKSHFSSTVALVDGSGNGALSIDELHVGNKDDSPIVILGGSTFIDNNYFVYRADSVGQTELHTVKTPYSNSTAISGDGTAVVHTTTGGKIDIINPVTRVSQQIGSSFTAFIRGDICISDDASIVAFITDDDISGSNPDRVAQIFTLSTDGNDTLTQVTNFSSWVLFSDAFSLSGDGSTIFFSGESDVLNDGSNADGSLELFSIEANGANLKQLTNNFFTAGRISEIRSDQLGATLAFVVSTDGDFNLYSADVSTGDPVFLSDLGYCGGCYIWRKYDISSDGSTVYFYTTTVSDAPEIYSVNSNGTNNTLVLSPSASVSDLHSSSTGASVTFLSSGNYGKAIADDEGSTQVYTLTP